MKTLIQYGTLLIIVSVFTACEKDDFGYGPERTMQFGTETAIVRQLTFPSGEFTIVGDLRSPQEGENHPVVLIIHGSGGTTRDAVKTLSENPAIDINEVGLWGISQAGWVMPKSLDITENISWMVVISGGGEDGIEQGAYQVARRIECGGASVEEPDM